MYELDGALADRRVDPGTNVLIAGPPLSGKRRLGFEMLAAGAERGEGAIVVTTKDSAERVLGEYRPLLDDAEHLGIVDCVTKHQGRGTVRDSDAIRYASSPEDMTGIGIRFSDLLEEFTSERGLARNRVLFHSVSTLLMYSDLQTVFRFMHVFTNRVEAADAVGVYLLESTAHDAQVMNTLGQLFDGLVRTDDDGGLDVQLPGEA